MFNFQRPSSLIREGILLYHCYAILSSTFLLFFKNTHKFRDATITVYHYTFNLSILFFKNFYIFLKSIFCVSQQLYHYNTEESLCQHIFTNFFKTFFGFGITYYKHFFPYYTLYIGNIKLLMHQWCNS